jgi:hypothetical protein
MSNRDGFGSGFWLGTLVGGAIGGIVGATIVNQRVNRLEEDSDGLLPPGEDGGRRPLKSRRLRTMDRMELARRSLDDKISDLNNAIDAVRSSVGQGAGDSVDSLADRSEAELSVRQPADSEG